MSKSELESKHLAELHELAAEAGVERYRMLSKAELVERLAGDDGEEGAAPSPSRRRSSAASGERGPRRRERSEGGASRRSSGRSREAAEERPKAKEAKEERPKAEEPEKATETAPEDEAAETSARPRRKRRRRWGRRRKGLRAEDLLLPAGAGRQALVFGEGREACTTLLRELAAELAGASDGPDPIAVLIDPSPEELAEWRRDAPEAEIVAAGKAHHAGDALAQARARADRGEDVIVLVDSLTRFAESFGSAEEARELFDAGIGASGGSLTVLAALERS